MEATARNPLRSDDVVRGHRGGIWTAQRSARRRRANGANPIPIIIPCHRVIGADGTLTGFGGGLPLKQALLELEGAIPPPEPTFVMTPGYWVWKVHPVENRLPASVVPVTVI